MTAPSDAPESRPGRSPYFYLRVTILLVVLAAVLLYAWSDVQKREARRAWQRTLLVAFVIVEQGDVDDRAIDVMRARADRLEDRLADEFRRYRPGDIRPVDVMVIGPVAELTPPPTPPEEDGLAAAAKHQWAMRQWTSRVDERSGQTTRGYDSVIYLVARPPERARVKMIEGASEQGGRVGVVAVELDDTMADFALFVAAHELFHTLGATDKYAPDGSVLLPDGLAEPERVPQLPQRFAEVMARHRPVTATQSKPPEGLEELAVGPLTAREIGWAR